MHERYLSAFAAHARANNRIVAAWLEGSFGRGNADRYSDLDVHLLLHPDTFASFQTSAEAWLGTIEPLVLYQLLFDGKMINALTHEGLRLDVWLHAGDTITLDPRTTRILFGSNGVLRFEEASHAPDTSAVSSGVQRQIAEFWRCIALMPAVIGRGELIVAFTGLSIETNILADILISGYGMTRDRGVKILNQFLPATTQSALEAALTLHELSPESLVDAQFRLVRILREHGPLIAARHGFPYPTELEAAVLTYVRRELELLGLNPIET